MWPWSWAEHIAALSLASRKNAALKPLGMPLPMKQGGKTARRVHWHK
jgi:hypothetical protein